MNGLVKMYRLGIVTVFLLFATFTVGLVRAMIDAGKIRIPMSQEFLHLHITFALLTGALSVFLLLLSNRTGLLFPRYLGITNLVTILIAGTNGLLYLLTNKDVFSHLMLYSFEISFGISSMLIGYLYCFYKTCLR